MKIWERQVPTSEVPLNAHMQAARRSRSWSCWPKQAVGACLLIHYLYRTMVPYSFGDVVAVALWSFCSHKQAHGQCLTVQEAGVP